MCDDDFVAELERQRVGGQVPVLEPAVAEAVHALLHAENAQLGKGRGELGVREGRREDFDVGIGIIGPEGRNLPGHVVQRDKCALFATHEEKRRAVCASRNSPTPTLTTRDVHRHGVLVHDAVDGVLKNAERPVHAGNEDVSV